MRDSISQPGEFVLTLRWTGNSLSFMINKVVNEGIQGRIAPVSFQFEEDAFFTIQELIYNYRQRRKPITQASQAVLKNGVPRSVPLNYYNTHQIPNPNHITVEAVYAPANIHKRVPLSSPTDSPEMYRRGHGWSGSQPVLSISHEEADTWEELRDKVLRKELSPSFLERSDSVPIISVINPDGIPKSGSPSPGLPSARQTLGHVRSGSAPLLGPGDEELSQAEVYRKRQTGVFPPADQVKASSSESELTSPPPPKPSRTPSIKYPKKPVVLQRNPDIDDDDRDYSDYGQIKETPSWLSPEKGSSAKSSPPQFKTDQPQRGRRAARLGGKKFSPTAVAKDTTTPPQQTLSQGLSFSDGTRFSTGIPLSSDRTFSTGIPLSKEGHQTADANTPPSEPTSNLQPPPPLRSLTRRLSERTQENDDDDNDYDNNFGNVENKNWFNSLPNRGSRKDKTKRANKPKQAPLSNVNNNCLTSEDLYGYSGRASVVLSTDRDFDNDQVKHLKSRSITTPSEKLESSVIQPELFSCDLLPKGHKVLDQSVLVNVKTLLLDATPGTLARHVTSYDFQLMRIIDHKDLGVGVVSGLELLTLPSGFQLRQDVVERWECCRMFTQLTLLTSQSVSERAQLLSLWIQTSLELKTSMGNLFSFTAIMTALTGEQISRLTDTWLVLRQHYTASAYVFDTKLRPALITLNNATSDLPLDNVSIPHVLPVCQVLEMTPPPQGHNSKVKSQYWELGLDSSGTAIDVLLVHLDTARVIASQVHAYRAMAVELVNTINLESRLTQVLSPEFHLLIMWGEKGWGAARHDRITKLEQIYSLLSYRYQVPGDDGTEL